MGLTKQITKNFFWLFFGELLTGLISFFIVVYLARVLGVRAFGLLNFVQAFMIYLIIIADAGLTSYGIREAVKDKAGIARLAINIISLKAIWGLVVYSLAVIFMLFLPMAFNLKMLFAAAFLLVIPKNMSAEWIFQGLERFEFVGLEKILNRSILALLIVLFVKNAGDLIKAPLFEFLVGMVFSLMFLVLIIGRMVPLKAQEIKCNDWRKCFLTALPMGISYVLLQMNLNIDAIMLGLMNNVEAVGLYSAAYKIIFALLLFSTVLGKSIYPALSRLHYNHQEKLKELVATIFNYKLFIAIPIAIGGTILSGPIILLVFGLKYSAVSPAFSILIWKVLLVYIGVPFAFSLLAAGRQKEYFYSIAAGSLINILLNFYLIPHYGFIGAAFAAVATEIIVLGMTYYYFSKSVCYIPFQQNAFKYIISAVIMGLFIYFVKTNLFFGIIGGAAIYLFFNLLFKSVNLGEGIRLVKQIAGK